MTKEHFCDKIPRYHSVYLSPLFVCWILETNFTEWGGDIYKIGDIQFCPFCGVKLE